MTRKTVKPSPIVFGASKSGALNSSLLLAAIAAAASLQSSNAQLTGWNKSAPGSYDYNDTANWVGGIINGQFDPSLTLTGAVTATFGSDTPLSTGLNFSYNAGGNFTLTGTTAAVTMTLGGDILVNTSGNQTITIGSTTASKALNVDLGGQTRTFTVGSGKTLGFINSISNGGLVLNGGTINFSGANTYSGSTVINSGAVGLNGATGSAANSDFFVNLTGGNVTSLTFASSAGSGTTRAKSVTLNGSGNSAGAVLGVTGNASSNSNDVITNALTASEGYSIVQVSANAARNAQLTAGSFVREAGSTILFRGSNLGVNNLLTNGSGNIVFNSITLSGTGALGTTTAGIIAGAIGETTTGGSGSTGGMVTYDATKGVRLLNTATEYTATIANGQTQLDNVRLVRASGGASQDVHLTAATTTINSLSFSVTGAGTNSGITISGDAGSSLVLSSGMIYANQAVTTATASDAMTISVPTLDLNGNEGVFYAFTNGINQGNTSAPLSISSVITNDAGKGLTIGGAGQVIFTGSQANTYTGVTTLNSGILRLNTSGTLTNIGLSTDLVMNGGTLLKKSESIADTASVTINGGNFVLDSTTSSGNNGGTETVKNFTMNGGSVSTSAGTGAAIVVTDNLALNASQLRMNAGGDITVGGTTTLNSGTLVARESSSTSTSNALTTLNTVNIINTASSAYTAMVVNSHATNRGALVTLNGDVNFTGNGTNTNTVSIASSNTALANQGVIALNGTRTFNVGNGAAAVDLTVTPGLVDSTSGDGLTKTGLGTLLLGGTNTFTGATTVNAGTLVINGSSVSAVTVNGGAFGGTGTITNSVSIGNSGTLAPGNSPGTINTGSLSLTGTAATISMEISGTGAGEYDQVNVTGGVNLDGNGKIEVTMLSFVPQPTDVYFLILNDGIDAISGTLYGIAQGGTFTSGGYTWQVSYTGNSATNTFTGGNDLALQIIPEPAAWMLVTGGLMAVTFLRRRRAA